MLRLLLLFIPFIINACILIPFTEPDAQARGEIRKECALFSCKKRQSPSYALQRTHLSERKLVGGLIVSLESSSDVTRTHASTDLGNLGGKAKDAVPKLELLAKSDPSKWVRRSAVKALHKIGAPSSYAVLSSVSKYDTNKYVRESATNALSNMRSNVRTQLK